MLAVASCLWIWETNQRCQLFSSHGIRISLWLFPSSLKWYPPTLCWWNVLHHYLRKGKIPRHMCTHKFQEYLFNNALRDLFLMQITQAEIILSFRLNYIPYISGASWIVFLFFFFCLQLLQFLECYFSTGTIRLLLPKSLQLYSERMMYHQSSHLYHHTQIWFIFLINFFHFWPAVLHHLGALERRKLVEVARSLYSKKSSNGLTSAVMGGGLFFWLWAITCVKIVLIA